MHEPPTTLAPRVAGLTMALLAALLAATLLGCSEGARKQVREWTYPPDFNYLSSRQLRSIMGEIATAVATLDALLRTPEGTDEALQTQVVVQLRALDAAAQRLGPGGWPSNHPRITDNAQRFQRDVRLALRAADNDPPRYFLAGTLSGSCSICHDAQ